MNLLSEIQDTAQQVVSAIASAFGVETAIIDTNFSLLATSKTFFEIRGDRVNKDYVQKVFQQGTVVVTNPGLNKLCRGCEHEGNCPETAEILKTIIYQGQILGVVLMIAYTQSQREKLLNNPQGVLDFIQEMAHLLCNKIELLETIKKETLLRRQFETTVKYMDKGIITIDGSGRITQINDKANAILSAGQPSLLGKKLEDFIPTSAFIPALQTNTFLKSVEVMTDTPVKLHCIISANPILIGNKQQGAVVSISEFTEIRSDIYSISERQIAFSFEDIYGKSPEICGLREYARKIASTNSTILIQGESGTGKEVFVRAIHNDSPRRNMPFVPINCAAIPDSLLESELFGYEHGAFSGAKKGGKPGKFEMANGGTLFLDEIGEMPLHMQVKLLRVLQEQSIERIGSLKSTPIDVRVIAATNKNLKQMVNEGKFREDLFFRLNVMPLCIPPLRQRKEDIPELITFFLNKYNAKNNKQIEECETDVLDALCAYEWPGNIRELENLVEYAINVSSGKSITLDCLPDYIRKLNGLEVVDQSLTHRVKAFEKKLIQQTLEHYGFSVEGKRQTARRLGISLPTLYRKLSPETVKPSIKIGA